MEGPSLLARPSRSRTTTLKSTSVLAPSPENAVAHVQRHARHHSRTPSHRSLTDRDRSLPAKADLAIRGQIHEDIRAAPSLDDCLLGDKLPREPGSLDESNGGGIADYTYLSKADGGLLGAGKFSAVYLATKGGKQFAVKHTPLYPHHPLIAQRLLREPTILAQLPTHRNLISVSETIRTPGHFYLVERALMGYVTLDKLVTSYADGRLPVAIAKLVLDQLVSVIREALHTPIRIVHRDIKPENILIHPASHHLVLLDFGLATHYSSAEAKLTTCCGSPAYHAPELWLSARSPPGSVRYWGPEIDIWCVGVSMLRCLVAARYPLGISHQSLEDIATKVAGACDKIPDDQLRSTLAGMLDMDGLTRMDNFRAYQLTTTDLPSSEIMEMPRDFKSTSFVPIEPKHTLALPLMVSFDPSGHFRSPMASPLLVNSRELPPLDENGGPIVKSSSSESIESIAPTDIPTLEYGNPTEQPSLRIVSFIKYLLRCHGVLYQACEAPTSAFASHVSTPSLSNGTDSAGSSDLSDRALNAEELVGPLYLRCVIEAPRREVESGPNAHDALLSALRPPIKRAVTLAPTRSSSTPPKREDKGKEAVKEMQCLSFWMSIRPGPRRTAPRSAAPSRSSSPARALDQAGVTKQRSKSRTRKTSRLPPPDRIIIQLSDERALATIQEALSVAGVDAPTLCDDEGKRGRSGRDAGVARDVTPRGRPISSSALPTPLLTPAIGPPLSNDEDRQLGFFDFAKRQLSRVQSSTLLSSQTAPTTPEPQPKPGDPPRLVTPAMLF